MRSRPPPLALLTLLLGSALGGCMDHGSGQARRFHETVLDMNKSTRWGQLGDAAQWVEPSYREKFAQTHLRWGQEIQVADSEVVSVQMAADQETAIALVTYEWYLTSAMTLHSTVVRQRWTQTHDVFLLASEVVVQGDQRLLDVPKRDADAMSADAQSLAPPG